MSNNKPTVTSKTAKNLKIIVWSLILSIVVIVALVAGWWLLLKKDLPPPPNHYEQFLTSLKQTGWQPLDTNAESELRTLKNEYEIAGTMSNLQNAQSKGNLSVSLMFVPTGDHDWLKKEFTNFKDNSSWNDIVKKRDMLRTLFEAFVASNVLENPCRLNSSEYPYLVLTCRIAEEAKNLKSQPLQKPEWKTLPFFSNNDVLRVKSLSKVIEKAREAKLILQSDNATVLDNLCRVAEEQESIQAGVDYEMKEAKPEGVDIKKMTEAVLKFIGEIKPHCSSPPSSNTTTNQ